MVNLQSLLRVKPSSGLLRLQDKERPRGVADQCSPQRAWPLSPASLLPSPAPVGATPRSPSSQRASTCYSFCPGLLLSSRQPSQPCELFFNSGSESVSHSDGSKFIEVQKGMWKAPPLLLVSSLRRPAPRQPTLCSISVSPFGDILCKCKQILKKIIHLVPLTQILSYSIHLIHSP